MVVNNGSRDDTLEKVITAYNLVKANEKVDPEWKAKPVRAVYKSNKEAFFKLMVIDKVNGGKSNALNTGAHCLPVNMLDV